MRSIEDMTVLVTGATDGLGRSVAADLAHRGATVLVHGRDPRRGERALADIRSHTEDARLELHLADFAHLAQVAELADEVERLRPDLNGADRQRRVARAAPGRPRRPDADA